MSGPQAWQTADLRVVDAGFARPVAGAVVTVQDDAGNRCSVATTGDDGRVTLALPPEAAVISVTREGFAGKRYAAGEVPPLVRLLEERLIGHQGRLWFQPGQRVEAFIHAPVTYSAALCRHGLARQVVAEIGSFPPMAQTMPDGDPVSEGLDWTPAFSYTIPEDARPGLYSLRLEAEGQPSFAVPMVVSTPAGSPEGGGRVLVLASTNTWQSYNIWGGRSRYRNFEAELSAEFGRASRLKAFMPPALWRWAKGRLPLPVKSLIGRVLGVSLSGSAPWKHAPLSVRRPFTNCALDEAAPCRPFTNHLAAGEWRVLHWLEREGYEYDIITGFELDREPERLSGYRAVILSTHCEYWSRRMYAALKAQHEQHGLWIVNLSGNSIYREVEFAEDGTMRCVSLSFADSVEDETQLLGVRFDEYDYGTCAPFRVVRADHWVFDGLPVRGAGSCFGGLSLNQNTPAPGPDYDPGRPGMAHGLAGQGASGWETDKLSVTAPSDITVVAKGANGRKGGADMVVREPAGTRGGMFSASSLTYGGALPIDAVASGIVRNVLRRALGTDG